MTDQSSARELGSERGSVAGHTPGPWSLHSEGPRGGLYWIVSLSEGCETIDIHEDENGEANARLISLAPEMLDALKSASEAFDEYLDGEGDVARRVRALIARAEGRS